MITVVTTGSMFVEFSCEGMYPKKKWSLRTINTFTEEKLGFTIINLYSYDVHNTVCKRKLPDSGELDEYMWDELVSYIEQSRKLIYDTCRENNVNVCESYFLSLKFVWSTLKKFRSKFFRELDNREDYDKTMLKIAINHLMYMRLAPMMADKTFKFSAKAADGRLGKFRTDAAWEVARYLAEETGAIFHAKVTI